MINQLEKQIEELDAQIASLQGLQEVLAGNVGMIAGTKIYFDKVEQSIPALIEGSNQLKENYETFNGKIGELAEMLKGMLTQMGELKDGINTLSSTTCWIPASTSTPKELARFWRDTVR